MPYTKTEQLANDFIVEKQIIPELVFYNMRVVLNRAKDVLIKPAIDSNVHLVNLTLGHLISRRYSDSPGSKTADLTG
jgi:hypothetical protein